MSVNTESSEFLAQILKDIGSCVVSFSGGVDSSLLLLLASRVLGASNVMAATFISPLHPEEEKQRAKALCKSLRVHQILLPAPEMYIPEVISNNSRRCYFCKKARIASLKLAFPDGIALIEGSNDDDKRDPGRFGNEAMAETPYIRSPLAEAGLDKEEIRRLAMEMGISWWDEKPTACLATRFPFGEKITLAKLTMVEKSERAMRGLGFGHIRVRAHKEIARIEIPLDDIDRAVSIRKEIVKHIKEQGFKYVTLDLERYLK